MIDWWQGMSKKKIGLLVVVAAMMAGVAMALWWLFANNSKMDEMVEEASTPRSVVILKIYMPRVEVLVPGESNWREGVDLEELVAGTRVRTNVDGRAEVRFPGGTVTRLDRGSEILLESVEESERRFGVELMKGKIWSRVSRVLGKITYESKTARTVATVRGTEYGHEIYGEFDRVVVVESQVGVVCVGEVDELLVADVQVSDWGCEGSDPEVKESSVTELIEDEWYRFNLYDQGEWDEQREAVLGESDQATPTPKLSAPPVKLIECKGPDGKVAKSTQQECDRLWEYWNANPPPPAPYVDFNSSGGGDTSSTPAPTVSVRPSPVPAPVITGVVCNNPICSSLVVTGSGFGTGLVAKTITADNNQYFGTVTLSSSTQLTVDFVNTQVWFCDIGTSLPSYLAPGEIYLYYDVSNPGVKTFTPSYCSSSGST